MTNGMLKREIAATDPTLDMVFSGLLCSGVHHGTHMIVSWSPDMRHLCRQAPPLNQTVDPNNLAPCLDRAQQIIAIDSPLGY